MGFSIEDLADEKNILFVNFWNWHPTVEIIRSLGIVDDDRLELMHMQCVGAQISEAEACEIGDRIQNDLLSEVPHNGRIKLDLTVTTEPDDGKMHYGEDADENYSATREWLQRFAGFCLGCRGFKVM